MMDDELRKRLLQELERSEQIRNEEWQALSEALNGLSEQMSALLTQQEQIIELLKQPSDPDSLKKLLEKVLSEFFVSLQNELITSNEKLIEGIKSLDAT